MQRPLFIDENSFARDVTVKQITSIIYPARDEIVHISIKIAILSVCACKRKISNDDRRRCEKGKQCSGCVNICTCTTQKPGMR